MLIVRSLQTRLYHDPVQQLTGVVSRSVVCLTHEVVRQTQLGKSISLSIEYYQELISI